MALNGLQKMVRQVEIKSDGDFFHEVFTSKPHHLSTMSPTCVQNVEPLNGEMGNACFVGLFKYTHDGKEKIAKNLIESIDDEKKTVVYNVMEGDIKELYKSFIITVHVDSHGDYNYLVTWTIEYEKLQEDVEDPTTLMDFFMTMSKDIETHHLNHGYN